MAIPVIDFSELNGEERAKTLAQIANGCEEWGFFQLVNHGIPDELLERVKEICSECYEKEREQIFRNSMPVKLLNHHLLQKKNTNNGGGDDEIDHQNLQNMDWEDVFLLVDDQKDWPSNLPGFKETMGEYRTELKKLAEKVMAVMDENLKLPEGYIKAAFNNGGGGSEKAFFGTKVSHYPPCTHPELVNGLRAHTDAGGVILLFQDDQVSGLQILKDGKWMDVQPLHNAIVINTGDQIEVLSNGRYKSVWHRVLARPSGNRRSIASFYNPSLEATIAPAPQLQLQKQLMKDEENINREVEDDDVEQISYPEFLFGDYMSVYAEHKFLAKEPRFQAVKVKASCS